MTAPEALTVRPRKALIASWVGAVVTMVLFTVIAAVLRNSPTGVFFRLADQIAMLVIGAFVAGGVLLLARPRVRADGEGIEVRNILVTRYVPWSDVVAVTFPDQAPWARLELPDDEYLSVLAIQAVDGARAVAAIRRVRALHAAARAG
ncbi:MAG TPA: PH domain-containing protein [Pseudonocardia sp.]|nr:PH domain-containing protein [Pseudonocardia sp.]